MQGADLSTPPATGGGLRLWLAGLVLWIVGHAVAVYAARKDPQFMEVLLRHLRHKTFLGA